MFFAIKKDETQKMVKANNYNELVVKAASAFKVNPNSASLTYVEPNGEQFLLDSDDTYEYVEQRTQELKVENATYKPSIVLGGDTGEQDTALIQHFDQTSAIHTQISRTSIAEMAIKPETASESGFQGAQAKPEVIYADRDSMSNTVTSQVAATIPPVVISQSSEEEQKKEHLGYAQTQVHIAPLSEMKAESGSAEEIPDIGSPSMSGIQRIQSVPETQSDSQVEIPGTRATGFMGQKTQKILQEMDEDLAGMGVGNLNYDEEMMMKQPTAVMNDPANMNAQVRDSQVNQNQVSQPVPAQPDQKASAEDQNFDQMVKDINRRSIRQDRSQSEVPQLQSQVSTSEVEVQSPVIQVDQLSEYAAGPAISAMGTQILIKNSSQETDTTIKRLPTQNDPSQLNKTATNHVAAPIMAPDAAPVPNPALQGSLQVPFVRSETTNSFVTDFSMKNYSQYQGNHPQAQTQMTPKELKLTQDLNQAKTMLASVTPMVTKQAAEIRQYKAQIAELTRKNQELAHQSQSSVSIPCFRCDGRQTEKGRPDPCRRCKGTGRVNTQHEKFLIEMIQSQVEKQIPVAIKQKELAKEPTIQHPGVTCSICHSNPLIGTRYLSLTCEDFNICERCEVQTRHSRTQAMVVIHEPNLSPDEFIEGQAQMSERRKAARAQEIISESLIKQESGGVSNSQYQAKYQNMSIKKNCVFKAGDQIENVWTFRNTGIVKIPMGIKFVMVAGDQELNQSGMVVSSDVKPQEFFKLKISVKAPSAPRHYSAGYMLIDESGNYFGDKVVLDVIVEDDCSEAVILAEMMDNVDMSMSLNNVPDFNARNPREERVSMMIHKQPIPSFGKAGAPVGQAPPQRPPQGIPQAQPQMGQPQPSGWGIPPQAQPVASPRVPVQQPPIGQPPAFGMPAPGQPPQMMPHGPGMQPPAPGMQQPQGFGMPPAQGIPNQGPPPQAAPPQAQPQQPPQERSAFEESFEQHTRVHPQQPGPPQPPVMQPPSLAGQQSWAMPPQGPPQAMQPPAQPAPAWGQPPAPVGGQPPMGQPAMGQPQAAQPPQHSAGPQDFFNQGPMRYPTMTGMNVDPAGITNAQRASMANEESKAKPAEAPQAKPTAPQQPIVQYGNQPPALPQASSSAAAPADYNGKLEQKYPSSRNSSDPINRQMRETFFLMKDFGYDNFDKNAVVIQKFKDQGKLDDMMGIQQALERDYNGGGRPSAAAAANQPNPMAQVQAAQARAPPQSMAPPRQESMAEMQAKIAYSEKCNKKLKEPTKTIMLQLMELGYADYDKNLKLVKKEKKPNISTILDKLNQAP